MIIVLLMVIGDKKKLRKIEVTESILVFCRKIVIKKMGCLAFLSVIFHFLRSYSSSEMMHPFGVLQSSGCICAVFL